MMMKWKKNDILEEFHQTQKPVSEQPVSKKTKEGLYHTLVCNMILLKGKYDNILSPFTILCLRIYTAKWKNAKNIWW